MVQFVGGIMIQESVFLGLERTLEEHELRINAAKVTSEEQILT